jgi:hypothetical protein
MKKRAFLPIIAIMIIALVVAGFTGQKKAVSVPENSLEERIAALESEIAELKVQLAEKGNRLQPINDQLGSVKGEQKPFLGPRAWTEGTQGWEEDGANIWTTNLGYNVGIGTAAPAYNLDVNGDIAVSGGVYDGASFGALDQVLVADGSGGVAWGGSPAGAVDDYIWNQYTSAQSPANWWIDGKGKAENATADDTSLIGISSGDPSRGVYGESSPGAGSGVGVTGVGGYFGVVGWYAPNSVVGGVLGRYDNIGVFGQTDVYGGAGVFALGFGAEGVYGETDSDTTFGVLGWNSETAGGTGICGIGDAGTGGWGYWGGSGVSGSSDDVGVFGYGNATSGAVGVYGYGSINNGYGVRGYNSAVGGCGIFGIGDGIGSATYYTGAGVSGCSDVIAVGAYADATAGSYGMYSRSIATDGLGLMAAGNNIVPWTFGSGGGIEATGETRGIIGFSDQTVANGIGVYGYSLDNSGATFGAGVFGRHLGTYGTAIIGMGNGGGSYVTLSVGSGGAFTGDSIGLAGFSFGSSGNVCGGYFDNFNGALGSFCYIAYEYSGVDYKVIGSGIASTIMETREGNKTLFCPESPEPWFEDIGEGQLINGSSGRITLDPKFLDCITVNEDNPLKVFVQLRGNCNGVYVKTYNDGFEVVELQNGTSDAKFCYRVIGAWKGYENTRFPDAPTRHARNKVSVRGDKIKKADINIRKDTKSPNIRKSRKVAPQKKKTDFKTASFIRDNFGKRKVSE